MPVVADCVVTLPLGAVSVNETPAPEAGVPPLVTVAFAIPVVLDDVRSDEQIRDRQFATYSFWTRA